MISKSSFLINAQIIQLPKECEYSFTLLSSNLWLKSILSDALLRFSLFNLSFSSSNSWCLLYSICCNICSISPILSLVISPSVFSYNCLLARKSYSNWYICSWFISPCSWSFSISPTHFSQKAKGTFWAAHASAIILEFNILSPSVSDLIHTILVNNVSSIIAGYSSGSLFSLKYFLVNETKVWFCVTKIASQFSILLKFWRLLKWYV